MSSLFTVGETMGLFGALAIGRIEHVASFGFGIGGAESNVAIGVTRLGGAATWLGRLGSDATGDMIARRLRAEGVHTMDIRDESFTGLMVKHRRTGETMQVDYHRAGSAGSRLTPADIPSDLAGASLLHLTGITPALSDSARAAVFHAAETARASGVAVSFDLNYRSKLWSRFDAAPVLRDLATRADVLFAGPDEAELIVGAAGTDLPAALAALGPVEVVVKDGARGCTALLDGVPAKLPALPVTVVDPVGAGDAFVAGYLAARLAGWAAPDRLRQAVAAGAFAVTVPGDCEGLPSTSELDDMSFVDVRR
ncbi:sugar kinase [Mangrovihabitans endophyticus]|uniref:Sugar kinase n=1 Tax=Mangrovihabitans endophyticus TaxID=1751298 RepID=A0A8J3BVV4_9ACTN|nr:sugar kinase [Mangrovihabitans endophyticus]GGK81106.1 sugar kinase [Mangrovihabitans endophyticus]